MENNAKAKALSFLKEYKLGEVTVDILTGILEKQGYQLVEFPMTTTDLKSLKTKQIECRSLRPQF